MPERAAAARAGQRKLGAAAGETRTAVLRRLEALLAEREADLLAANAEDLAAAERDGLEAPLKKRLGLSADKLATLREGVAQLAATPDPIGEAITRTELDAGLELTCVKSPLGVLLIIFESRPDAVIQIGSLALRAGDAVLLKGGKEAAHSNRALVGCLRDALAAEGLDPDAVQNVEGREAVAALLELDHVIDLVIPRGSGELVRTIQTSTRIPVLGHAEGVCHLYLDAAADPALAERLAVDGKCDYPAACNATETLLVHEAFLPHLPRVAAALTAAGVTLRADEAARAVVPEAEAAADADWRAEYGDLTLAVRVVPSLEAAIDHIHRFGSAHTESIVTTDERARERASSSSSRRWPSTPTTKGQWHDQPQDPSGRRRRHAAPRIARRAARRGLERRDRRGWPRRASSAARVVGRGRARRDAARTLWARAAARTARTRREDTGVVADGAR